MRKTFAVALMAGVFGLAAPGHAALTLIGQVGGNECGGAGGFGNCWATQSGTQQGAPTDPAKLGSPTVYKRDSVDNQATGTQSFGIYYPSVDGTEFTIAYDATTNTLSWTYAPGAGDPELHYVAVFQGGKPASGAQLNNSHILFYDADPITSGSLALSTYFTNKGWSHITFFNKSGGEPPPPVEPVPAPAALGLFGLGLAGLGLALRRRRTA